MRWVTRSLVVENPLGQLDLTGVEIALAAASTSGAPVQRDGTFSNDVSAVLRAGTATFVKNGQRTTIPLAGARSPAVRVTPRIRSAVNGVFLDLPVRGSAFTADRSLAVDVPSISAQQGGTQTMTLSAGSARNGASYFVLGSRSGTIPGVAISPLIRLSLNVDSYTELTAMEANSGPFGTTIGRFGPLGIATATLTLPPLPALRGTRLDHAYLIVDANGTITSASTPVAVTLR